MKDVKKERKDCWNITVLQEVTIKVACSKSSTKEEAKEELLNETYDDIIDEDMGRIKEIISIN